MRAEDSVGNGNFASSTDPMVTVDKKKPTPTIAAVSGTKSSAFPITINFDEDVRNFGSNDISVLTQSGDAAGTASNINQVDAAEYTATITPSGSGTLRISVSAGAAEDDAGNTSVASMNVDVAVDTEGATPTITAPTDTQNGPFDVTIDFGEDVSNFLVGDLTVVGATKASNWQSGKAGPAEYTITLTPTIAAGSTGTVTIDVAAGAAQDAGNNGNEAASRVTVSIDKDAPTLTITAPTMDQNGAFDVTFTFDQDVIDFAPGDVSVTNANDASSWKSSTATTYVLTLTPRTAAGSTGTVTIDVAAGGAEDAAGNGNEAASQASVSVDKKAPTVSISGLPSGEQKDAFDLTITFDEVVTGFAMGDLRVTGQATATAVSGGPTVYTATITPNANQEDDVTVRVEANTVEDAAGNGNTVSATTSNIHIDTIAPTATISGLPSGPQKDPFNLTITFSEDVSGFEVGDLRVTNQRATATAVAAVSGSDSEYTATITPNANQEGDVKVRVRLNRVEDAAGNSNPLSDLTPAIRIDTTAPTVLISGVPTTTDEQNDAFDLTITFSEDVTGFATEDLTVIGFATATAVSTGPMVYTATITPSPNQEGVVRVRVEANTVTDTAGNGNTASVDHE